MKKAVSIISFSLLFVFLVSCGSTATLLEFMPQNDSYEGFGGYEFIIMGGWPKDWDPNAKADDEEDSNVALSVFEDALLAHNAKIMSEYDCKITAKYINVMWSEKLYRDIVSDSVDYHLFDTFTSEVVDSIKGGFCTPWEDTAIDISDYQKYGSKQYQDFIAYDGKHYGIWPEYWQAMHSYRGIMGVNSDLLKKYTDSSVHELYENGKWTFDEFKNILMLLSEDENLMPLTIYDKRTLLICSLLANGSNIVNYDETLDKYNYGFIDQKAVHALEYVKSLNDEGLVFDDLDYGYYFDVNQVSPFYLTATWTIGGNVENMDMICFPFGPDAEYGVDVSSYRSVNERYVFMPQNIYPDEVGKFVDIWFNEIEGYPKSVLIEDFKTNNFYNDKSFDIWMDLAENAKYDYAFAIYNIYSEYMESMSKAVFSNGSIYEFIDSYENRVQDVIDANLNK